MTMKMMVWMTMPDATTVIENLGFAVKDITKII